jgi:hypothetical protein
MLLLSEQLNVSLLDVKVVKKSGGNEMKSKGFWLTGLLCAIFLIAASCSLFPPYNFEFKNNSSYTVDVLNLQSGTPSSFKLSPGARQTAKVNSTQIVFQYTPANLVQGNIDAKNYSVTFVNK